MGEVSDVTSRSASSTRHRPASDKQVRDRIVPVSPVLLVQGNVILLPNIQAQLHRWVSEYHFSDVQGWEGLLEAAEVRSFDGYAARFEGKGD